MGRASEATKNDDLCPSVTDLFPIGHFCYLYLTIYKLVSSTLLIKEDNGEKAQCKLAMVGSFFLGLQTINSPYVTQLNFVISPSDNSSRRWKKHIY